MAVRDGDCGVQLEPYIISTIEGLDNTVGRGCYRAIYEVRVSGVSCIAKRLHDILLGREREVALSQEDKEGFIAKFTQECLILSKLRHLNILQFMGVHIGEREGDITLIMESTCMDLEQCIQTYSKISLSIKLRILRDIGCGLTYLHSLSPVPILHCDLIPSNVLLTNALTAKITDLGVSKIIDYSSISRFPGHLAHIPPEAMQIVPVYNTKFDCFSFGHLSLYVLNGKSPEVVNANLTLQDIKMKQIEIAKRRTAIDMLGPEHILRDLVQMCLSDKYSYRPTSQEIVIALEKAILQYPEEISNILDAKMIIQEKTVNMRHLTDENLSLKEETSILRVEVDKLQKDISTLRLILTSNSTRNKRSDVQRRFSSIQPTTNKSSEKEGDDPYYTSMTSPVVISTNKLTPHNGKEKEGDGYEGISAGEYDYTLFSVKSIDLDDFYFGVISYDVAENLCTEPGEYLVRVSPTKGELILTLRQAEVCIHFNIHKEESRSKKGTFVYYIEEKTRQKQFTKLTNLIIHITNERRKLITKEKDLYLHPTSKREKQIISSRDVNKRRVIHTRSSSTYFDGLLISRNEEVVIVVKEDSMRALAEANILRQLSHSNIVRMVGVCVEDPVYLLLETDARNSLHEYIKGLKKRKRLIEICQDVCCGMVYLHSQKYLHRSLQSQSCIVTRDDTVKISDFSKSCYIGEKDKIIANDPICIPTRCAAPEVLKDALFSPFSDVWSYGILVWEVFNQGQVPYHFFKHDEVEKKIKSGFRLSLPSKHTDYDRLVDLCLQFKYDTRPTFLALQTIICY